MHFKRENACFKKELQEVAIRLQEALTYLMNVRETHSEPRPSGQVIVTGPNTISLTVEPPSFAYSWTAYGPPPKTIDIQGFWNDVERNVPYKKAVDYYLKALASKSESEVASQLYKAIETLEIECGGEAAACRELKYSKRARECLKWNLNYGKRHVEEKFEAPPEPKRMPINECLDAVREIIETFRQRFRSK